MKAIWTPTLLVTLALATAGAAQTIPAPPRNEPGITVNAQTAQTPERQPYSGFLECAAAQPLQGGTGDLAQVQTMLLQERCTSMQRGP